MIHRSCHCRRSPVRSAVYSLCLVFVLPFVFFEMLDLDGSDLKILTTPVGPASRPSATKEDDDGVRRVVMQLMPLTWLTTAIDRPSVATAAFSVGWSRLIPVVVICDPTHHIALPRASLEIASSPDPGTRIVPPARVWSDNPSSFADVSARDTDRRVPGRDWERRHHDGIR